MGKASDRLGRAGDKLRNLPEEGVQFGTAAVRRSVLASLKQDAGSDRKLSGLRNGRAQTVKVTTRKAGNLVEGRVMAGPRDQRAPWFWLEEGTASGGRRVRTTSRRHRGRLTTYEHPGVPAFRTWSRGVGEVTPKVRKEFERLWRKALNDR